MTPGITNNIRHPLFCSLGHRWGKIACLLIYLATGCGGHDDTHTQPPPPEEDTATETESDPGDFETESGDGCLQGNQSIREQYELDQLADVECIEGNLSIGAVGDSSFEQGFDLPNLKEIRGDLILRYSLLTDLEGFSTLATVGGDIRLEHTHLTSIAAMEDVDFGGTLFLLENDAIHEIAGFNNLTSLGGLYLEDNANLQTVSGFNGIAEMLGSITITQNKALSTFSGFDLLQTMEGSVVLDGTALNDFTALGQLEDAWGFWLSDNPNLAAATGLESLNTIWANFTVEKCPALTSLSSLANLQTVGGTIRLINLGIVDLSGLDSLTEFSILRIQSNSSLASLNGWNAGNQLPGALALISNPQLTDLSALNNLTSIGSLRITSSDADIDYNGLATLESVERKFELTSLDALTTLAPLAALETVGELVILNNDNLSDCEVCTFVDQVTVTDSSTIVPDPVCDSC